MKIKVMIGAASVDYVVMLTRAPREYDGFGTFTLQDWNTEGRLVCIREEHLQWQLGRNGSGGFSTVEPDVDAQAIQDALWARLWRGNERGIQTCPV